MKGACNPPGLGASLHTFRDMERVHAKTRNGYLRSRGTRASTSEEDVCADRACLEAAARPGAAVFSGKRTDLYSISHVVYHPRPSLISQCYSPCSSNVCPQWMQINSTGANSSILLSVYHKHWRSHALRTPALVLEFLPMHEVSAHHESGAKLVKVVLRNLRLRCGHLPRASCLGHARPPNLDGVIAGSTETSSVHAHHVVMRSTLLLRARNM